MGAATVVKDVLGVLKGTTLGKKLATEVEAAESARAARVAARAKLDEAAVDRERIPALADALAKAKTKYHAEMERLAGKLAEAQREYSQVASQASTKHARGEGHLRRTAHPLVHDAGPPVRTVESAITHLRRHALLVGDEDRIRRTAKLTPRSAAREDREFIEHAVAAVRRHDEAMELMDAFRVALDELRDLQLEVDVDPTAVREAVDGLPRQCVEGCHTQFTFAAALAAATELEIMQ